MKTTLYSFSKQTPLGPCKAETSVVDNKDGSCSVEYLPTKPGKYDIAIKFADEHIPGL